MPNAYIHYVKRRIVTRYPKDIASPWYSELQTYSDGFNNPCFHVTRLKSWPVKNIEVGDVIWLVGQLSSPWGKLPPSIDAKIKVASVESVRENEEIVKYKFLAQTDSRWLPLNDATELFGNLQTVSKAGKISTPCNIRASNIGQAFQSIKKIANSSLIDDYVSHIESLTYDFISYRIADGTRMAFEKSSSLMNSGKSVFWDRWSLPRRLAERRELVEDLMLDKLLLQKINDSSIVWGVESPRYNEVGSYSSKEKILAVKLKKYRSIGAN